MYKRKGVIAPRLAFAVILLPVVTFSSYAHDSDRIEQLEREVQETKERLSKLESMLQNKVEEQEPAITDDGSKSVSNWKRLTSGMSARHVQQILGYPEKVDGAKNAVWYYKDGGIVKFYDGNVDSWSEPE